MKMWLSILLASISLAAVSEEPFYDAQLIFDPDLESHGHVHASCIVECPNGDLRAVWYENGPELPPPFFNKQKDKSGDVRIGGSRMAKGAATWDAPFVMADTYGVSDNNPCMVVDAEGRLWLVYASLIAVPINAWGSALVRYHVSSDYDQPGPPVWEYQNILSVHLNKYEDQIMGTGGETDESVDRRSRRSRDPFKCRLGWMPRAHPLVRSDGAVILPLSNENYNTAAMAITKDAGHTWTISNAVPGSGVIQPTVVEFPDGEMAAFFRNGRLQHCILRSNSSDGGMTWSELENTDLPHPGSGIEAVLLKNGHLAMIYNDKTDDPRDSLAVSISTDRGKTWEWIRHLEKAEGQRFDYPSLVQGRDGSLHATYSVNTKTIKYAHFNEAWVQEGDQ